MRLKTASWQMSARIVIFPFEMISKCSSFLICLKAIQMSQISRCIEIIQTVLDHYTKVKSLQKHWQRDHVDDEIIQGHEFQDDGEEPEEANLHTNELHDSTNVQRHAAKFLLASKVDGNITQAALESVKESSESLIAAYLQDIRSNLERKLRENDPQYQGLETEYMQNECYRKNFNLVVSILLFLYYKKWASDYFKI